MNEQDFSSTSKEEAVAWFANASDSELAQVVRNAERVDSAGTSGVAGQTSIPLMLTSIRLPVELVRSLDELATAEGITRSEAIRLAVSTFVQERRGDVSASEAERALDVLRRIVGQHVNRPWKPA